MTETSETPDTTETDSAESSEPDESEAAESSGTAESDGTESSEGANAKEEPTGPDPRLLEELDEHIRGARAAAEEALGGVDQTFVESGDDRAEAEDDQTIAPPG